MEKTKTKATSSTSHKNNKLSILISQDGLCFCGSVDGKINDIFVKDFSERQTPEKILTALKSSDTALFLNKAKAAQPTVEVFYANGLFTLVPLPYFQEEKLSDYLKYNIKLLETDEIAYDYIEEIDANAVYIPYVNINNYLFDTFGEFSFHHYTVPIISSTLNISESNSDENVLVEVFNNHFIIAVVKNGKLLLCNNFDYYSHEDLVYYMLFVIQQLELDKEALYLHLSGTIKKSSKAHYLLRNYIRNIAFLEQEGLFSINDTATLDKALAKRFQLFLNTI